MLVRHMDSQNNEAEVSTFLVEGVRGMLRGSGELIRQNKCWQPEGIRPITIRLEGMSRGDKPTRYSVRKDSFLFFFFNLKSLLQNLYRKKLPKWVCYPPFSHVKLGVSSAT